MKNYTPGASTSGVSRSCKAVPGHSAAPILHHRFWLLCLSTAVDEVLRYDWREDNTYTAVEVYACVANGARSTAG